MLTAAINFHLICDKFCMICPSNFLLLTDSSEVECHGYPFNLSSVTSQLKAVFTLIFEIPPGQEFLTLLTTESSIAQLE